jgi:hypothetical protein
MTAINTWKRTNNFEQTAAAARQKAEDNGTIRAFEVAIFSDGLYWLARFAPLLYDFIEKWMNSKND